MSKTMPLNNNLDYYGVLNLDRKCSSDDVKRAYKLYSQAFHPDRHRNDCMEMEANEAFFKIKKAYTVLIDPEKRKLYDNELDHPTSKENKALTPYMITDYSRVDLIEERNRLLKDIAIYSAVLSRGSSSVTLNLMELVDPKFESSTFLEKLMQSHVDAMALHQEFEFELSQSNIMKFNSQIILQGGFGKGLFGVGVNHLLSPSSNVELTYYIGEGPKFVLSGTKIVKNQTKCSCIMTGGLHDDNLFVGYQLKVTHPLMENLKTTIICENISPPELTLKLSYVGSSFFINTFTKIGGWLITYGTNIMYKISNNLIIGLSGSVNNEVISGGYSAEYNIDNVNKVYGSVGLSPSEGVLLKLNYQRQNQTISFPIILANHLSFVVALVGTLGGILCAGLFDLVVIKTLKSWDNQNYEQKLAEENQSNLTRQKIEAKIVTELMKTKYDSIVASERLKNGLIILKAIMGELTVLSSHEYNPDANENVVDIKIPLQYLVKDSKLVVKAGSKYSIPGFYKINTNNPVIISIIYSFNGSVHKFSCNVEDPIILPKKCHLISLDS